MPMSWLEYSQMVLEKVHFDPILFRKELRKALRLLSSPERRQLLRWCRTRRGSRFQDLGTLLV